MTAEQYKKATELLEKINRIRGRLDFFDLAQNPPSPCEHYISNGQGYSCPIPSTIEKEVLELVKTEYCKQLETLKKELEKL